MMKPTKIVIEIDVSDLPLIDVEKIMNERSWWDFIQALGATHKWARINLIAKEADA